MTYKIQLFPSGPFETNAMVLSCVNTQRAVVIDPGVDAAGPIRDYVAKESLTVEKILITHSHWDHIGNVAEVAREFRAPVAAHLEDWPNLEEPGSDGVPMFVSIEGVKPALRLQDGQRLQVGELELEVLHTPGHSPGSVCFYCTDEHFLIGGDLVFRNGMGRLDLPTGQAERMWGSLARVAALPPETIIYPGHGEETTVGQETWLLNAEQYFGG